MGLIRLQSSSLPAGSVLQVKMGTTNTSVTATSSAATTSIGLLVSITPTYSSSKILVMSNLAVDTITAGSLIGALFRGSTQLGSDWMGYAYNTGRDISTMSCHWLDEPNTTSTLTYEFKLGGNTNGVRSYDTGEKTIIVMEIAG